MTTRRTTWWAALGAAVLVLAAVGYLAVRLAQVHDDSFHAGREYGASQALMYHQHTVGSPSDDEIREWCRQGAELAATGPVWFHDGVIQVGELDRNLFVEGCFEAYRAATE
ncbi:succinate dehydrogenase [Prescottella subtropica]|uniref:succinate dehydrogenase n=1 Tax=Prescottella subtropica TaxID=2545757 RepID=UPI0010F97CB4|nr:succinate dehydrogenase [Prescottella subtropica]